MRHFLSCCLFFIIFVTKVSFSCGPSEDSQEEAKPSKVVSKYIFLQQTGCACHFMPAMNFRILQGLRESERSILDPENFKFRKIDCIREVYPVAQDFYNNHKTLMDRQGDYAAYYSQFV